MRRICVASHANKLLCQLVSASRTSVSCPQPQQLRFNHVRATSYNVGILGGGITGLVAAYRLTEDPNCDRVTLYEKSASLGGWLQSETIDVNGGRVVFEYGPRTLRATRPEALPILDLMLDLGLEDDIVITDKDSPAAINRYIYYPDHIVRMPGSDPRKGLLGNLWINGKVLLTEPALQGFFKALLEEPIQSPKSNMNWNQDESISSFVGRRLNKTVADNVVSALYHGIYAGDIEKLSAHTILGFYCELEKSDRRVLGSLLQMARERKRPLVTDDLLAMHSIAHLRSGNCWRSCSQLLRGASTFTLRKGLNQLVEALKLRLESSEKVEILTGNSVDGIAKVANGDRSEMMVKLADGKTNTHDCLIATIPAPQLGQAILSGSDASQRSSVRSARLLQQHNYAVSVMVVNLYYDKPDLIPYRGFGYLIPRSIPYQQNPEQALGVIFASESSAGQDTAPGTKLTVMLGGHWWDDLEEAQYPDEKTAIELASSLLERHLGIKDRPAVARACMQKNAIPQYTVGHLSRMNDLSQAVRHEFDHHLSLAGSWYSAHGVGIIDCVRQAYLAASYGVGARRPEPLDEPWKRINYREWDLEGGIQTADTRYFIADADEVLYYVGRPKKLQP